MNKANDVAFLCFQRHLHLVWLISVIIREGHENGTSLSMCFVSCMNLEVNIIG